MSTPDAQPSSAAPKSKKILIVVAIVLGILAGGGAGVYLAGPLLAGSLPARSASAESSAPAAGPDEDDEQGDSASRAGAAGAPVHLVDNMVLNPARSGGARFLLLSVAFAVKDASVVKSMADRDPELRDVILRELGAREVEELADITRRDSIKIHLRSAVQKRFGKDAVRDVYFPQFVIQ